jgi:peptidylprolyl isomerase
MIPLFATLIGRRRRLIAVAALALVTLALGDPAMAIDAENVLVMELTGGTVTIEMRPDLAPNHVARIRELARQGFYDGIVFHRVIAGFMAQTGDPTGTGSGGSGKHLKAEFSQAPHNRGTLSMARTNDPDSADSQFFICLDRADYLDGQYTVWGQVVSGMEAVDKIKKGSQSNNGAVTKPDSILSLRVAADIPDWRPPAN